MSDRPFTEYEQRFLLAEILKTSNAPIDALLNIIRGQRFEPNWEVVGLPAGRSVKNCVAELENLHSTIHGDANPDGFRQPSRGLKRTQSATGFYGPTTPATKAREIKPKPADLHGTDKPANPAPAPGFARKRGRPSNAELAERARAASERGEVYQGSSVKRKSMGDQPEGTPLAQGSEPPAKRGRGRPPKNKAPLANSNGEKKPSEEVTSPADAEENGEAPPNDDPIKEETQENHEVIAHAASTSESLVSSHENGTDATSTIMKKMLTTSQTPPSENSASATAN